jgi:hypothetical protein
VAPGYEAALAVAWAIPERVALAERVGMWMLDALVAFLLEGIALMVPTA